jgi:hypothetical protein
MSGESFVWKNHINFIFSINSICLIFYFIFNFNFYFLFLYLVSFIPNPKIKIEGTEAIFSLKEGYVSLILKEKNKDKIFEVFVYLILLLSSSFYIEKSPLVITLL